MPYTKEQLVSSQYFQDILSANRRAFDNQVEREFAAMKVSGSSVNSTPTLRNSDGSVILFEDPDFGGGLNRPNQFVEVQQTRPIMKKNMIDSALNRDIEELGISADQGKGLSVSEFFSEYERLRDDIKGSGLLDSHQYLVEVSRTYLSAEEDSELVQLKDDMVSQISALEDAQDSVKDLANQLQNEIIATQNARITLEGGTPPTTPATADDTTLYNAYITENEGDYANEIRSYTFDEWVYFAKPKAGKGWDKLRATHQPASDWPDVVNIEFVSGNPNRSNYRFSTSAKGDDSLSYRWYWKPIGQAQAHQITQEDTGWENWEEKTISLLDPALDVHDGILTCRIMDRSGKYFTSPIEIRTDVVTQGSSRSRYDEYQRDQYDP